MKRLLLGLAALLVVAAGETPPETSPPSPAPEFTFARLLVMPFSRAAVTGELWQCPRCGAILMSCAIEDGAEATLAGLLDDRLREFAGFAMVPQEEINRALAAIPEPERTQARLEPWFPVKLAQELKADAVLISTVSCFRQRSGTAWASGKPAAAAFELELVAVADRRMVWQGRYQEEQKPLSENLLEAGKFFRRGAKWVNVDVLARDGLAEALKDFPAPKSAP